MGKFIITEEEKKNILSMYNVEKGIVSEQTLNTDGTYTTKYTYKFIPTGGPSPNPKFNPTFKAGTKIWTNFNKPEEDKIYFGTADYYLTCSFQGYDNVIQYKEGDPLKENSTKPTLTAAVRKLFCNGKNGKKTWKEITGKTDDKKETKTNKTIKLNPSEEEKCQLLGDKTWSYAKQKDRWFTTKDGVNWYEITNNKKAVAILTDPTKGCKNIKELVAFVPPPVADVDFSQVPIETQKQVNTAKTNVAPDQDNEERPV